jgi:hypothetical protein
VMYGRFLALTRWFVPMDVMVPQPEGQGHG